MNIFSDLCFDWFDAIHYIFTRKGSFLRFKDRNTTHQKLSEKKLTGDRNCCPCMFCHSNNILPKERPSLTSICYGEKALSLRIAIFPNTFPARTTKIFTFSFYHCRLLAHSS